MTGLLRLRTALPLTFDILTLMEVDAGNGCPTFKRWRGSRGTGT